MILDKTLGKSVYNNRIRPSGTKGIGKRHIFKKRWWRVFIIDNFWDLKETAICLNELHCNKQMLLSLNNFLDNDFPCHLQFFCKLVKCYKYYGRKYKIIDQSKGVLQN